MSSPSEPVETDSISMALSFLPSRMTEPLPNWRSIWDSAAERALDLSMEVPSTIRRAGWDIIGAPYRGFVTGFPLESLGENASGLWEGRLEIDEHTVPGLFSVRNMFLSRNGIIIL